MRQALDLTNQRFGKLVAKTKNRDVKNRLVWDCICDCGNIHTVLTNYLTAGDVRSCGCLNIEKPPRLIHGKSKTRIYSIWSGMHRRCTDTNHIKSLQNYISQNISVCHEWETIHDFEYWALNNGYEEFLTLDRINGTKGYYPENCRWVTEEIQSRNRKKAENTSSKFIGVNFDKARNKWHGTVHVNNKKAFHKRFNTELEAAQARDEFIKENNLDGFKLNFN